MLAFQNWLINNVTSIFAILAVVTFLVRTLSIGKFNKGDIIGSIVMIAIVEAVCGVFFWLEAWTIVWSLAALHWVPALIVTIVACSFQFLQGIVAQLMLMFKDVE